MLSFESSPSLDEVGQAFGPRSMYFSPEALMYHDETPTHLLIARMQGEIAGALTWKIDSYGRLAIGNVERIKSHKGHGIGTKLILESARINHGKYHGSVGYLNDRRNASSARMFELAGYIRMDELKFYKS